MAVVDKVKAHKNDQNVIYFATLSNPLHFAKKILANMDRGDFSNFRSVNLDTFSKKSLSRWKKKGKKSALGSQRSKKIIADTIEKIQGDRIHKQLFVTDISMQKSLHNTNQNDNGSSNNDAMIDHIGRM